MKITVRQQGESGGIACLPMAVNIPKPMSKDWKKVSCPICGADCWESDLARKIIAKGTMVVCTMCALKIGLSGSEQEKNHDKE